MPKLPGIGATLLEHGRRARVRRGEVERTAILQGRNSFNPTGADYDLDASGDAFGGIGSPSDDFDEGQEVIYSRGGDYGQNRVIRSLADPHRQPTQNPQRTSRDLSEQNTI